MAELFYQRMTSLLDLDNNDRWFLRNSLTIACIYVKKKITLETLFSSKVRQKVMKIFKNEEE